MRWQVILGTGAVVVAGLVSGCGGERKVLASDLELAHSIAQAGLGPPTPLSRAQKPEDLQTSTRDNRPLDREPERPSELAGLAPSARIRATVNGQAVLEEEIRSACFQAILTTMNLPEKDRIEKQAKYLNDALDQLIDRELIMQDMESKLSANKQAQKALDKIREAATKEFEHTWVKGMMEGTSSKSMDELKDKLRQLGISYEMGKRHFERHFMSTEFAKHNIFPTIERLTGPRQIQDYYEGHPEEFTVSDMVEWQDIFIAAGRHPSRSAARRFAEVLAARAHAGESFAKLAEQFDNGDSSLRDNFLGIGQKRGEVRPAEAEPILFQMREGEVNLVELSTGFHVVKSLKRTPAGLLPFDEKVQTQIRNKLRMDIYQREMKRFVTDLRRKAIIVKYEWK
jgi:hypothetical protein